MYGLYANGKRKVQIWPHMPEISSKAFGTWDGCWQWEGIVVRREIEELSAG